MSMEAINWARRVRGITAAQKCVLLLLADRASETNECWPSISGLADDACMTERGVSKCLHALVGAGVLSIDHGRGRHRTSIYRLPVGNEENPNVVPENPNVVRLFRDEVGAKKPERGSKNPNVVPENPNHVPKNPNHVHPNPKEPKGTQGNPKKVGAGGNAPIVEVLPTWLPPDVWASWCDYRRGKRWTPQAAALSLRNLAKLRDAGNDPRAVIEQSIANGWTGLFPDKQRQAFVVTSAPRQTALSAWRDLLNPADGTVPTFDFDATAEEIQH